MSRFPLGVDFPREGFVQGAVERHFASCARVTVGPADFACTDEAGRRWLIEAKGETSDVGLDSGLGLASSFKGRRNPTGCWG
jgi:hypothetical protein